MATDPMIGQVLNRSYRIMRLIGRGAMAAVYEATNTRIALKRYALKILLPSSSRIPDVHARFLREAQIAAKLEHPNIVEMIDFDTTEDGKPYMVMELLEGESLGERIERCGPLSFAEVQQLVKQAASALQAAHDNNIVHRDLKPQNIFLVGSKDGPLRVKLLDFGISKIWDSQTVVTNAGAILGTPQFMSPEQAAGRVTEVDQTTDTFALAVVCYLSLAGTVPFDAPTLRSMLRQVCSAEPTPLTKLLPSLPPAADQVLNRALSKNKQARYQRIDDFASELCAALSSASATSNAAAELSMQVTIAAPVKQVARYLEDVELAGASTAPDPEMLSTFINGSEPAVPSGPWDSALFHRAEDSLAQPISRSKKATQSGGHGKKRSKATVVMFACSAVLLVCAAVLYSARGWLHRQQEWVLRQIGERPEGVQAGTAPAESLSAQDSGPHVRVFLKLDPADAQVLLDDTPQKTNPLVLEASARTHHLVVLADGYRAEEREFVARESTLLTISLEKSSSAEEELATASSDAKRHEAGTLSRKHESTDERMAPGDKAVPLLSKAARPYTSRRKVHSGDRPKAKAKAGPRKKLEIDEGDGEL